MAYSATFAVAATHQLSETILQALDATSATQIEHTMGRVVKSNDGRKYQYVHAISDGDDIISGGPFVWDDADGSDHAVTINCSDAGSLGSGFAGVSCISETTAAAVYLWIQTKGRCNAALVDTDVDKNDGVIVFKGAGNFFSTTPLALSSVATLLEVGFALTNAYANSVGGASRADIMLR